MDVAIVPNRSKTMAKCMYKDGDGMCCRSTCAHHCKVVTDNICQTCILMQDKPFVSKAQQLRNVVREAFDAMPALPANAKVMTILREGLRI